MIKEVVLRRFKRFEAERFDLRGHVILAGPNNCGKTTVLQAIAAWALALRLWREKAVQQSASQTNGDRKVVRKPHGAYSWVEAARLAFTAVPLRSFDLLWKDRDYRDIVEVEVSGETGWVVAVELKADSSEQIYVRPRKDVPAEMLHRLNLDVVHVATVGGLSTRELKLDPESIETLLGEQKPGEVVRNLLLQVSKGNSWQKVADVVQRLFGVELLTPQTVGGQIVCEYRQPAAALPFDLLNAGAGMQQVVMLLACLYWRRGSVVLVDEPDAHLHVFLQDSIFSELRRAAAETKSQLVIATHSEVIFNSAAPEQICVMMGRPRRLSSPEELKQLRQAVAVLQQSDLIAALAAPGILYLEGYTDLSLLREWARILQHPAADYLSRTPFWHPVVWNPGQDLRGIKAQEHYSALQLVKDDITGIWMLDADGKARVKTSDAPERGKLNRLAWKRYETESYLVQPTALARFLDAQTAGGGAEAVRRFLAQKFGEYLGAGLGDQLAGEFVAHPSPAPTAVERYLAETKARTTLIGGILQEGGVHGMDYTQFSEIAAVMLPEEIHPEVKEKLDFIQQAFGL
jgi:hypothetical protein